MYLTKGERQSLIVQIQEKRNSSVIAYILGDRKGYPFGMVPNLATQIADDALRPFVEHLQALGHQEKIDLFLYSRGGETNFPLRLVRLIREYCNTFSVLVPYRAHSAATMICLGADEIVMGKIGELSPVDPTTANVFNPIDPLNPAGRWPISVEDVTAYLSLAKDKAKLDSEGSVREIFKALTDKISPVALGNVHRVYNLIRMLVPKLLGLHMDITKVEEQQKVQKIVEILTEKLYTHDYLICRLEAEKEIGLKILNPNQDLEDLMWKLYKTYESDIKLLDPFDPRQILGTQQTATFSEETGYIESTKRTDAFVQEGELTPPPTLQQIQQIISVIPPQLLVQIVPQLIQITRQLSLYPPTVKFTSQKWQLVP